MISESGNITGISKLPAEVLSIIFTQCMDGPTLLPFSPKMPVQIVISHVCLSWRYVALGARNLWANVYIELASRLRNRQIYSTWLTRAGQHPISLALDFYYDIYSAKPPVSATIQRFIRHFPIRHLTLSMYSEDFCGLWVSEQDALSCLERLDIGILFRAIAYPPFNIPATVIGKVHSAIFSASSVHQYGKKGEWIIGRQLALPWVQLRDLEIDECMLLSECITLLQQMPLLEQCSLSIYVDKAAKNMGHLTLSHLQGLSLSFASEFGDHNHIDAVIHHFTCPNLTLLDIEETEGHSTETWDMIRQQYNLHRLQDLFFTLLEPSSSNLIPSSGIFRNAPMLRNINIGQVAIMDEETCAGMVIGAFGRFLHSLEVSCKQSDIDIVLGMVKDRQLAVAERLKSGCSWQDEMASLKELRLDYFAGTDTSPDTFDDKTIELERIGVKVTVNKI